MSVACSNMVRACRFPRPFVASSNNVFSPVAILRSRDKAALEPVMIMCQGRLCSESVAAAILDGGATDKHRRKNTIMAPVLLNVTGAVVKTDKTFVPTMKRGRWKLQFQLLVERAVLDCRFFSLFGVAGSLVGSILCFMEGVFAVLESYFQYFHSLSQRSDHSHVVHLLIEAIDIFLVGTAMMLFGMGIYVMFVGAKNIEGKVASPLLSGSNLFGLFCLRAIPAWIDVDNSVPQAKSRFGHALTLLLQVGMLEKFRSIPLITPLDLACFAGAILVSSACIFLLSRLTTSPRVDSR